VPILPGRASDRGPAQACAIGATGTSSGPVDAVPASAYMSVDETRLAVVADYLAGVLHSLEAVLAALAVELRLRAELAGAVPSAARVAGCAADEGRT